MNTQPIFQPISIDPHEDLAEWWRAYLAIYATYCLDDNMGDNEKERAAETHADLVIRVWRIRKMKLLADERDRRVALEAKAFTGLGVDGVGEAE